DQYDYQGAMSLVKELTLKDGKFYQNPVPAMTNLRTSQEAFADKAETDNCYELDLTFKANQKTELLLFADQDGDGLKLTIDNQAGKVILDRSQAGVQYATEFGTSRQCSLDQAQEARIFVDKSIVEIFINQGEKVFTSRVFPNAGQTGIKLLSGQASGTYYQLKG
ncbi:GH32 C-terminal domain-containing protein, partial [Streptococcus sobrinus]